jgi:hypothetical protein
VNRRTTRQIGRPMARPLVTSSSLTPSSYNVVFLVKNREP